jgi:hypothetical protein
MARKTFDLYNPKHRTDAGKYIRPLLASYILDKDDEPFTHAECQAFVNEHMRFTIPDSIFLQTDAAKKVRAFVSEQVRNVRKALYTENVREAEKAISQGIVNKRDFEYVWVPTGDNEFQVLQTGYYRIYSGTTVEDKQAMMAWRANIIATHQRKLDELALDVEQQVGLGSISKADNGRRRRKADLAATA